MRDKRAAEFVIVEDVAGEAVLLGISDGAGRRVAFTGSHLDFGDQSDRANKHSERDPTYYRVMVPCDKLLQKIAWLSSPSLRGEPGILLREVRRENNGPEQEQKVQEAKVNEEEM